MNTKIFRRLFRYVAVFAAVLMLSGCVIIPTKAPVRQFAEPTISFLVPGRTTQSHVNRILGPPVVRTTDNSQWIYHERGMSREYHIFVGWSPDRMDATPVQYFLLLNFDDEGTLTGHHVEKNGSGCGDGICVARGKYYSIEADENDIEPGRSDSYDKCTVYMFTDKPRIGAWIGGDSVETSINDEVIGYLLDDDTYFKVSVDGGNHEIRSRYITNSSGTPGLPKRIRSRETMKTQQINFECTAGESYYFEHVTDRKTGTTLLWHDADKGAKDIARRSPLRRLVYLPVATDTESSAH